jgi:hypothetical protein
MRIPLKHACVLALALAATAAWAQPQARLATPHLADYDAELRGPDRHVDNDAMIRRLQELGVTTYYWLIWHQPTDWDDLKAFLPKAAAAHINIWAYLVPPTEGPPKYPASEPFKLDYMRWAEELARLSLQHTNLTGWVIDDFYANHKLFTPDYVGKMQARAKAVQPNFAFLPLMYFSEITPQFTENYRAVIDGVVVAYPQDREDLAHARAVLNGEATTRPGQLSCPAGTPTHPGDYAAVSLVARVLPGQPVVLRFREQDDFTASTSGYHFKQVLVDDEVLWEQDVAGGEPGWRAVEVDATSAARGKTNVTVTFRLWDKKGASNFPLRWRLKELRAQGLQLPATLDQPQQWKVALHGPLEAGFGQYVTKHAPRFHIPFIVMTAGPADQFKLRHGNPATPERIAEWLRMCLESWRAGECEGVALYCLDKRPQSPVFPLAQKLFHDFKAAGTPPPK